MMIVNCKIAPDTPIEVFQKVLKSYRIKELAKLGMIEINGKKFKRIRKKNDSI